MQYKKLGKTDLNVSTICLGTMTWGEQNTKQEAFEQLDYAVDQGVNFIDTAEFYSIPPRAETYGQTETIIGEWLKQSGKRDQLLLASKIAGHGEGWIDHIRHGRTKFNRQHIESAVNHSLKRLQVETIDLYQLHWPERTCNFFGKLGYEVNNDEFTPIEETLEALAEMITAGKIRNIGVSNETPWGVMSFIKLAEQKGLPLIASIQNPYSLLNRSYEIGLAEISHREQCSLLAYSPLSFGVLSGKYLNGKKPEGARLTKWEEYSRYCSELAVAATEKYVAIAREHQIDPAQMALAYVNSRPFVTSTIIGATNMQQLKDNIGSCDLLLKDEVLEAIESVHQRIPNPSP